MCLYGCRRIVISRFSPFTTVDDGDKVKCVQSTVYYSTKGPVKGLHAYLAHNESAFYLIGINHTDSEEDDSDMPRCHRHH